MRSVEDACQATLVRDTVAAQCSVLKCAKDFAILHVPTSGRSGTPAWIHGTGSTAGQILSIPSSLCASASRQDVARGHGLREVKQGALNTELHLPQTLIGSTPQPFSLSRMMPQQLSSWVASSRQGWELGSWTWGSRPEKKMDPPWIDFTR